MQHTKTILGLALASISTAGVMIATSLGAPGAQQPGGLKPVPTPRAPKPASLGAPTQQKSWRESLTANSFVERTQAFDQAVSAAARDPHLKAALEEWAKDPSQGELAWTAHLILHAAAKGPIFGAFPGGQGLRPLFGSLQPGAVDPFQGLLPRGFPQGMGRSSGKSFTMEATPDGVKVKVETNGPNGRQIEEYEAESLEELKAAHPEIFDGQLNVMTMPGAGLGQLFLEYGGLQPQLLTPGKVRTDVLGVMVSEVLDDQGVSKGLAVKSVFPGTIAEAVGITPGSIVVRVAGVRIGIVDDVKHALAGRADDEGVVVEWLDQAGQSHTETWSPDAK